MMNGSLADLTLSTMWMQHRFERVVEFADAARHMGFGGIEISHVVTPAMLAGADITQLAIRAVHFPAPTQPSPFGHAADALLTSDDETMRRWAVEQAQATIAFAEAAGARAVCLHLGEVVMSRDLEWALEQRYLGGQAGTTAYAQAKAEVQKIRRTAAPACLDAGRRSLDALADYARPRGIRLGIESRVRYRQIPTWQELGLLLEATDPAVVGFWYDCGHVQVQHNLGFHKHQAWLDAYAHRIVGVHLHDVRGLRDHLLPGLGEIDFALIGRHLPAEAVLTCELDWYFTESEIVSACRSMIQQLDESRRKA